MAETEQSLLMTPDEPGTTQTPAEGTQTPAPEGQETPPGEKAEGEGGEGQGGKPQDGAPEVPEKYDLKVPEDSHLDQSALDRIASTARELGLSNEKAQKLLDSEHQAVAGFIESQVKAFKDRSEQMKQEVITDPEIGGDKLKETLGYTKRVFARFEHGEEVRQLLNDAGVGNSKALIKFLRSIGRAMSEDKFERPGAQPSPEKQDPADILYGKKDK